MAFSHLLFDLDGTLTDPAEGVFAAVQFALQQMNSAPLSQAVLSRFIGPPLSVSFASYCGFDEAQAEQAIYWYRVYYRERGKFENEPYPGVEKFLQELKASGKTLIVATSKPEPVAVEVLEHFGLAQYFNEIAGSELNDLNSTKSKVIRDVLHRGNITDLHSTVMIGDREHDVIGARENQLPTIGVLYGYGSREELEAAGAWRIAADFEEIKKIVL